MTERLNPDPDPDRRADEDERTEPGPEIIEVDEKIYHRTLAILTNMFAAELHHTSTQKGFYDGEVNMGEKIALMHAELSEWLEAVRKVEPVEDKNCPGFSEEEIEAADTIIRILDICARRKLDIGHALIAKSEFNKTRPPKHGKRF